MSLFQEILGHLLVLAMSVYYSTFASFGPGRQVMIVLFLSVVGEQIGRAGSSVTVHEICRLSLSILTVNDRDQNDLKNSRHSQRMGSIGI